MPRKKITSVEDAWAVIDEEAERLHLTVAQLLSEQNLARSELLRGAVDYILAGWARVLEEAARDVGLGEANVVSELKLLESMRNAEVRRGGHDKARVGRLVACLRGGEG